MQTAPAECVLSCQALSVDTLVAVGLQAIGRQHLGRDFGQQLEKGSKNALVQSLLRVLFEARQASPGIGRTAEHATVRVIDRPLDYCDNLRVRPWSSHSRHS